MYLYKYGHVNTQMHEYKKLQNTMVRSENQELSQIWTSKNHLLTTYFV